MSEETNTNVEEAKLEQAELAAPESTLPESTPVSQGEMPFALVEGEPLTVVPQDLYIPPDALEVILDAFEGPLDLLLYLIKRQNLDILEINIADITKQYMDYIGLMKDMRLELAAEYLLMAAMLAEIKSRMLLPRPVEEDDEDDPRAELIRRLQEYERFKKAADDLSEVPRLERDIHLTQPELPEFERKTPLPDVTLQALLVAFKDVLQRSDINASHNVRRELLSVRERMGEVLSRLESDKFVRFTNLFSTEEGRLGVVVTFLSVLELCKEQMIDVVQNDAFEAIYVKPAGAAVDEDAIQALEEADYK